MDDGCYDSLIVGQKKPPVKNRRLKLYGFFPGYVIGYGMNLCKAW